MKKLYILFTAAAFTAAACTSNLEIDTPEVIPEDNTPEVVDPDNEGTTDGLVPLTFSIAAEGMTKTTIGENETDGYTVSWATTDEKVRIVWSDGSKSAQTAGEDYYIADVNAETGEVAGYIPAGSADEDVFYAVYPETADYTLEDGTLTITIPREQSGTFKDANIMVAKTTKAQAHLAFKNMTSIISFSTSASMKSDYKYITFAANQLNTYKLSGTVSTDFNGELFSVTTNASNSYVSKRSGKLSCGNAYYLAILPGADIENGLGFKLEDKDYGLICGGISKVTFSRARGAVASLGAIDTKVRESWFIKQDGSDTGGKDWDHAGNAKRLVELLSPSYSDNGTTAGWRLTGATIYVAHGEYNLQKNNSDEAPLNLHWGASGVKVKVVGSCTGSSTEQDLENCTTTFVCNQDKTTDHILQISGTVDFLSLDGITFTANSEATETNISGIALNCTSNNTVNVTFDKCKFTGITGSNTYGGSVIDITGSPSINFKGCTFKDNETSGANDNYGGAIRIENENANVSFSDDCVANNNDVTSPSGRAGFICLRNGKVTISGGSIKNSNTNGAAGAIFVNNAKAILTINNCAIEDNSGSSGGFLYLGNGTVSINGGTLERNEASTGSGGAIFQNNGTLNIAFGNDSTKFVSNSAANNGGAIYSKKEVNIIKAAFRNNSSGLEGAGGAFYTIGNLTVTNCSFEGNSAKHGAAIYGASGSSDSPVVTKVFNTLFKTNAASGGEDSGSAPGGGCVYGYEYNYMLFDNCTFSNNSVYKGGILSMGRNGSKDHNKMYLVSSTVVGSSIGIKRTSAVFSVYNSILPGPDNTTLNVERYYSIYNTDIYSSKNKIENTKISFGLGTYTSAGVYPLDSNYSSLYTKGMTAEDLQKLTFTNISLTDDQKDLLAKDQKGNDRGDSKIMGAYVLTTAPTTPTE